MSKINLGKELSVKRKVLLFLAAALLFSVLSTFCISADNTSCGTSAEWSFDSNTGTLYVNGSGAMTDYEKSTDVPWYSYRNEIYKISVSENITHIGDNAFRRLENLVSVQLPATLTSIGDKTFAYCYELRDISLPSAVKTIGESAFYYCQNITDISLPSAVKRIETDTFFGCQKLVLITMSDSVEYIGERAFYYCVKLSNLKLSASVESIGSSAFAYCESLKVFTCMMDDDKWELVEIASGNECLVSARRLSDGGIRGDVNGDLTVGASDAIYLLYSIFFESSNYPIYQDCDFNQDGITNAEDAIYLLYHIFFDASDYPI